MRNSAVSSQEVITFEKHSPHWSLQFVLKPHSAMSGIMFSRQQIDDVMAYLSTLPAG
jgi:hypothetical protein